VKRLSRAVLLLCALFFFAGLVGYLRDLPEHRAASLGYMVGSLVIFLAWYLTFRKR